MESLTSLEAGWSFHRQAMWRTFPRGPSGTREQIQSWDLKMGGVPFTGAPPQSLPPGTRRSALGGGLIGLFEIPLSFQDIED